MEARLVAQHRRRAPAIDLERFRWSTGPVRGAVLVQRSAHGRVTPGAVIATGADGEAVIELEAPVPRVAPGQSVVVYDGDEVAGAGIAA